MPVGAFGGKFQIIYNIAVLEWLSKVTPIASDTNDNFCGFAEIACKGGEQYFAIAPTESWLQQH
jgi:hypothetical protein